MSHLDQLPDPVRSTMLLLLITGPGDVAGGVGTGGELKATKSCDTGRTSYCELHLQLHHPSRTFQDHDPLLSSQQAEGDVLPLELVVQLIIQEGLM